MKRKKMTLSAAALAMAILILDSRHAAAWAGEGVALCIRTVIPSLFPFFVLSGLLTGSLTGGSLLKPLERLFRIPDGSGSVLVTGFLGGYPVGAQAAAECYRNGTISRAQANRMLSFCSQAGPSFLFGMAAAQFPGIHYGWLLWAVQLVSAWIVSLLVPPCAERSTHTNASQGITLTLAMKKALISMAGVCGWVVIFRVAIGFFQRWILWLLPEEAVTAVCGLLELTNGCVALAQVDSIPLRFLLAAAMLNFGGLCVAMQTSAVAEGLDMGRYWQGKLLQTALALVLSGLMQGSIWLLLPLGCLIPLLFRGISRKNSSIPMRHAV